MDLVALTDRIGESWVLAAGGIVIGMLFGAFAQQSRFCLRAAAVEFARGSIGGRTAIWLMVFCAAVAGTTLLAWLGAIQPTQARQIASPQSFSGAAIGGLMFGAGMVLARGCASRLLVLAATGNLRALLSGLVFAVVAQASLHGFLSLARERLAGILPSSADGANDIMQLIGLAVSTALLVSAGALAASLGVAFLRKVPPWQIASALVVGATVPLAWWFTSAMSAIAFDPVQMEGITFTGPSADTLMFFLSGPEPLDFAIGLVPGVFLGSFIAAFVRGELQLQGFEGGPAMRRYLAGAALMGFGGMLAGGCAVGAGVTGASVFALTAWITLVAIWLSAGVTDYLFDRQLEKAVTSGVH